MGRLLNDLHRIGAKGKGQRIAKDLGRTDHIDCLNRKLQGQVATVGDVGCRDPQRDQHVFGQLEVECRFCSQGS